MLLAQSSNAIVPLAHATRFHIEANQNHLLRLEPRFIISDTPENPLEIFARLSSNPNASSIVKDVRVRLHDLRHPSLDDVELLLAHGGRQEVLFNGNFLHRPLRAGEDGTLEFETFQSLAEGKLQQETHEGVSIDMTELRGANLATGCLTEQKSTGFDGHSSRAVDGVIAPHYSQGSVTHTGGDSKIAASKSDPWWQVHLNATTAVTFVRIFNRQVSDTRSEVQRVYTYFAGPVDTNLHSSFRLNVSYNGFSVVTGEILPTAVATKALETGLEGSGAGPAESLQSILQATGVTQSILVTSRSINALSPIDYGAREWVVTFANLLGNVAEMKVVEANMNCLSDCSAHVETIVHGGVSNHYIQQTDEAKATIENRLYPFLVAVLSKQAAASLSRNTTLIDVMNVATWSKMVLKSHPDSSSLSEEQWRQHVLVEVPAVRGDVVRIQLHGEKYLSLAEVQVYSDSEDIMSFNKDLERVVPDRAYRAHGAITQTLGGMPAAGEWALSIRDFKPLGKHHEPSLYPLSLKNGQGSLGLWSAQLTTDDGQVLDVLPDLFLRIVSLPQYGKLYTANISFLDLPSSDYVNSSTLVQGELLKPAAGLQQFRETCTKRSFCHADNREIGPLRTTDTTGGIVDVNHRLTLLDNAFSVIYEPLSSTWTGMDWFTFAVVVAGEESEPARVEVDVQPCISERCDVNFSELSQAEREVWTEIHLSETQVQSARRQWRILKTGA